MKAPRNYVGWIALSLAAGMLLGIAGIIGLALLGKSPPDILTNIVSGLVGACAMLVRPGVDSYRPGDPQ